MASTAGGSTEASAAMYIVLAVAPFCNKVKAPSITNLYKFLFDFLKN